MVLNRVCFHRDSRAAFVGPSEAVSLVGTPRLAGLVFPAAQGAGGATAGPPARRVFAPLRGLAKRPPPTRNAGFAAATGRRAQARVPGPPKTSSRRLLLRGTWVAAVGWSDLTRALLSQKRRGGRAVPANRGLAGGVPRREEGRGFHALAGITGPRMLGRTERRRKTGAGDDARCESFGQQRLFRVPA